MSFADDVKRFAQKAGRSLDATVRGVEMRLFRAVIKDSPVGDPSQWKSPAPPGYVGGRFRGNWQASIGSPAVGELDRRDEESTISEMEAFVSALKGGRVTFLSNNLPYAMPLEYGHSKQAPGGMVRKNVARFQRLVNEEARKNKV